MKGAGHIDQIFEFAPLSMHHLFLLGGLLKENTG